jgi:hypothetical protein
MPQWQGTPVTWEPWKVDPTMFICPPPKKLGCEECGHVGQSSARAMTAPREGETITVEVQVGRSRRTGRPVFQEAQRPAHSYIVALAFRCDGCEHVRMFSADFKTDVSVLLCDDCDCIAAAGATDEEARESLVALGGWTGGAGTDWDRCPSCAHDGVLRVLPSRPGR